MILDAFKVAWSLFPFLKEVFLWRDGAEEGKPVTKQNLTRRKIAVFALMGSIIYNYLSTDRILVLYARIKDEHTKLELANKQIDELKHHDKQCLTSEQVLKFVKEEVNAQCAKNEQVTKSSERNTGKSHGNTKRSDPTHP